jgi:hypothetical protein
VNTVREETESGLSDIGSGVGADRGGVADTLAGGGDAMGLTDSGIDSVAAELADQTDILAEILDELETGGLGGGGDGGGGGFFPGLATGAAGASKKGGGLLKKLGAAALGSPIGLVGLAGGAAAIGTQLPDPTGRRENAFEGGTFTFGIQPDNLDPFSEGGLNINNLLSGGGGGAPTDEELPGNNTRETIRQNQLEEIGGFQTGGDISEPDWLDELRVDRPEWIEDLDPPSFNQPDIPEGEQSRAPSRQNRQLENQGGDTTVDPTDRSRGPSRQNRAAAQQTGTDTDPNRAEQQRINRRGANTPDVNVTVNADGVGSRTAEDIMEEAKQEAVREIERKVTRSRREGL